MGNRHGFGISEIHPDYYQIPVADREALMAEERAYSEAMQRKDDEDEVVETDFMSEEDVNANQEQSKTLENEIIDESKKKTSKIKSKPAKSKPAKSKPAKSKPAKSKRKSSEETRKEKENSSSENINSSEEKVEKKPRGRPKKSQKPIAAVIDTESNDEVIQSDDLDGVDSEVKSDSEASESKNLTIKKRRYSKSSRKKTEDKPASNSSSFVVESDLDPFNNDFESEDDPKKEIEAVSEVDDEQDIRRIRKPRQRRYKIQVIKVRQIMLVQVVKRREE